MKTLKVENFVFCEDARLEASGKHVLISAFAPEVDVPLMPGFMPVAIWLSGVPTETGKFEIDFRVRGPARNTIINGKIDLSVAGLGPTSFTIGPMQLHVTEAGTYYFEWTFDGKKWEKVATLQINHVPVAVVARTAASAQPPVI